MLAVWSREAERTHTLVAIEERVALAAVLTHICGALVPRVHGHVSGFKSVVGFKDGRAHQSNLKPDKTTRNNELEHEDKKQCFSTKAGDAELNSKANVKIFKWYIRQTK